MARWQKQQLVVYIVFHILPEKYEIKCLDFSITKTDLTWHCNDTLLVLLFSSDYIWPNSREGKSHVSLSYYKTFV